jgi:integrase
VPIFDKLKPYLDAQRPDIDVGADNVYIFTRGGNLYSKIMQRDMWTRIIADYKSEHKKAWDKAHENETDIKEVYKPPRELTSHMLRHTYATILYNAGIDIKTAQKWMGDSTTSVVMDIYTHLTDGKELEAEKKMRVYFNPEKLAKNGDNLATKSLSSGDKV